MFYCLWPKLIILLSTQLVIFLTQRLLISTCYWDFKKRDWEKNNTWVFELLSASKKTFLGGGGERLECKRQREDFSVSFEFGGETVFLPCANDFFFNGILQRVFPVKITELKVSLNWSSSQKKNLSSEWMNTNTPISNWFLPNIIAKLQSETYTLKVS